MVLLRQPMPAFALLAVLTLTLLQSSHSAYIIPVTFQPQIKAVEGNDALLYGLYLNSSLLGTLCCCPLPPALKFVYK